MSDFCANKRADERQTNPDPNPILNSKAIDYTPTMDAKTMTITTTGITKNDTQKTTNQKREPPFMFAGIIACVLSSIVLPLSVLFVKFHPANSIAEVTNIVFYRGILLMIQSGSLVLYQGKSVKIKRKDIPMLAMRAIFSSTGPLAAYMALNYISLGDSTSIIYSSPVWTSLLSHFILGEPLRWIHLLALPACLFSVVLIAHPGMIINMAELAGDEIISDVNLLVNETLSLATSQSNTTLMSNLGAVITTVDPIYAEFIAQDVVYRWPGIMIALLASLIVSGAYISFRMECSSSIQATVFWSGFTSCLMTFVMMCFVGFGSPPSSLIEWLLIGANSFCGWLGGILVQLALQFESASIVSVVRTLDVVVAFILSAIFLKEEILWTSVLGATIISTVVVLLLVNDWLDNIVKRKFLKRDLCNDITKA